MKKLFIIILLILISFITTNVYAKNKIIRNNDIFATSYYGEGDLIPNDTYVSISPPYNYQTGEFIYYDYIFRYYDENGNLIASSNVEKEIIPEEKRDSYLTRFYGYELYHIVNSASLLWRVDKITIEGNNHITDFYAVPLEENQDIITLRLINYSDPNRIVLGKVGDLVFCQGNGPTVTYNFPNTSYSYAYPYDFTMKSFKLGYDIENPNNRIPGITDNLLISIGGASSTYTGVSMTNYNKPEFSIDCDSNLLNKNKPIKCIFKMKSEYEYNKININTKETNDYIIKNIKPIGEYYELKNNNNIINLTSKRYLIDYSNQLANYFNFDPNASIDNFVMNTNVDDYYIDNKEIDLFEFEVLLNETTNINELLSVFDIDYKISDFEAQEQLNKSFEILNITNPKTLTNILIVLSITLLTIISFFILRHKKVIRKIDL